jgi:hypothetical protein
MDLQRLSSPRMPFALHGSSIAQMKVEVLAQVAGDAQGLQGQV